MLSALKNSIISSATLPATAAMAVSLPVARCLLQDSHMRRDTGERMSSGHVPASGRISALSSGKSSTISCNTF